MHTSGAEPWHDLLPQHGRHLVAVETVEHAAGFLSVDEVTVELTRVVECAEDCLLGDLVEDHALHGNLRVQHLEQVPRDGFALAILICCEVELVAFLEKRLELLDLIFLVGRDNVERLEVVVDVDAHAAPLFALVGSGDVGGVARKISDVTDRGLHDEIVAKVLRNLLGLCGALHDNKCRHELGNLYGGWGRHLGNLKIFVR